MGYIPGAMSTRPHITMILPSPTVEWSVLYSPFHAACFVMSVHEAVANMTEGVASAFHGETRGVPPHCRNLQPTHINIYIYVTFFDNKNNSAQLKLALVINIYIS